MSTQVSSSPRRMLSVPIFLWGKLIWDLHRRGEGCRESGAFLLGNRNGLHDHVKAYCCYDDLDAHALDSGIIQLRGSAFGALWNHCRRLGLHVIADVHTHGDDHPTQSHIDRMNPTIPEVGHVAFILPRFAGTWGWQFSNVAIYEYVGDFHWREWAGPVRDQRVRFCLW